MYEQLVKMGVRNLQNYHLMFLMYTLFERFGWGGLQGRLLLENSRHGGMA